MGDPHAAIGTGRPADVIGVLESVDDPEAWAKGVKLNIDESFVSEGDLVGLSTSWPGNASRPSADDDKASAAGCGFG